MIDPIWTPGEGAVRCRFNTVEAFRLLSIAANFARPALIACRSRGCMTVRLSLCDRIVHGDRGLQTRKKGSDERPLTYMLAPLKLGVEEE